MLARVSANEYWIFVANDLPLSPVKTVAAEKIADVLLARGYWAFTEAAPLRTRLRPGDRVLIYLAGPGRRHFVARARIASSTQPVDAAKTRDLESLGLSIFPYAVLLGEIERFRVPVSIKPLIPRLNFISEKRNYGLHLRLPIIRIPQADFDLICSRAQTA